MTDHILADMPDPMPSSFVGSLGIYNGAMAEYQRDVAYQGALRRLRSAKLPDYQGGGGRGVLYVGGSKYWPGIVVGCHLLREMGSKLPIEVWHRGAYEPVDPSDVKGLNVKLIDLCAVAEKLGDDRWVSGSPPDRDVAGGHGKSAQGWAAKHYALTHTTLDTVLYLDADAYVVSDPTQLFVAAEGVGFAHWRDYPMSDDTVNWERVWGLWGHKNRHGSIQGGQLVMRRATIWRELVISHWLNQHADHYYSLMYGDQDTWKVAFAITRKKTAVLGPIRWVHPAYVCESADKNVIVHRCQGKLFKPEDMPANSSAGPIPNWSLPLEKRVFELYDKVANKVDRRKVFETIYKNNLWGGGSGSGSTEEMATTYAAAVNYLAKLHRWGVVTDAGCGDGVVAAKLQVPIYTGVDVAKPVIDANKAKYPTKTWVHADFVDNPYHLPAGDALLCKDVLQHLANEDITRWLRWVVKSGRWRWVVLTNDTGQVHDNQSGSTGNFRPLDPDKEPLKQFGGVVVSRYNNKAIVLIECRRKICPKIMFT